jgi:hypothetical protein
MRLSMISRSVFLVIALLVIVSCNHGGGKVEAGKAKEVKSKTDSTPSKSVTTSSEKPATKAAAARTSRVASAPTKTATNKLPDYNGVTQFDVR